MSQDIPEDLGDTLPQNVFGFGTWYQGRFLLVVPLIVIVGQDLCEADRGGSGPCSKV